jgi:small-conductance mechanosensitive channel
LPLIGIDITALSIFGGAIGVGIGFGLQKITSNFLSGFIILIDRSIKVGDRLVVDNNVGSISKITMRYVVMERFDGTEVLIPNETFITNNIQNQTYSNTRLRSEIVCNVGSQNDLHSAVSIIKNVIANTPNTISDKASTSITRLIDGGIEVKGYFWVTSTNDITNATNHIYIELDKLFTTGVLKTPLTNQRIEVINKLWN